MRENPRPTRHLEHVEPELFGQPVPGSISGPAWDLVPLPGLPDPLVGDEPPPSGNTDGSGPAAASGGGRLPPSDARSWKRPAMVVGGAVVAVLVLGIAGLALLGELRPDDADTTTVELADVELPVITPDEPAADRSAGPARRAESQPRRSEAPGTGGGAVLSPPGDATAASGTQPGPGGTSEGGADTGTEGGTGSSTGGDTGSSGGGSATPTATAPPPTSAPTSKPTSRPTPDPTPSASGEPTPDPTPTPSVSPTPEPSEPPMSPGTGQ